MAEVYIRVEGSKEVIQKLVKIGVKGRSSVIRSTRIAGLNIEKKAKVNAPVDTGRLRASIQAQFFKDGLSAEIGTNVMYAPNVEFGRRSGAKMPPSSSLEGWARRHGLSGLEYVIARSIGDKGINPKPFLFPAWEEERDDYINELKKVLKELEKG